MWKIVGTTREALLHFLWRLATKARQRQKSISGLSAWLVRGNLLDLLVDGMEWKDERRGTCGTWTMLFVRGHATALMWVYQQQSECRSQGVRLSVRSLNEQRVELTREQTHPRTGLSTLKLGFMSAVNCENLRDGDICMRSAARVLCVYMYTYMQRKGFHTDVWVSVSACLCFCKGQRDE